MSSRFHWVAAIKSKKDEEETFGRSLARGRETLAQRVLCRSCCAIQVSCPVFTPTALDIKAQG